MTWTFSASTATATCCSHGLTSKLKTDKRVHNSAHVTHAFFLYPRCSRVDGQSVSALASFRWPYHPSCRLLSIEGGFSSWFSLLYNPRRLPSWNKSCLSSRGCAPRCAGGEHVALHILIANPA